MLIMFDINHKLNQAEQAYQAALQSLAEARKTYEEQGGHELRMSIAHRKELEAKLELQRQALAVAQEDFQSKFTQGGYAETKAVRAALNAKNDAQAMIDELQAALARKQQQAELLEFGSAAEQAQGSLQAFDNARQAFAKLSVYRALQSCSAEMARVFAMSAWADRLCSPEEQRLAAVISLQTGEEHSPHEAMVLFELKRMARAMAADAASQLPEETGRLDVAPFARNTIPGPAARHQRRVQREEAALRAQASVA